MKLLANLGDASPLEYGGLLVIEEDDGGFRIDVWDEPRSDEKITIYQVDIAKFTYVNGVLSDNPYHPVWFADKLPSIAECNGCEVGELIGYFLSDNPVDRARGYQEVAGYYGWYEFNQYPLTMSVGKAARRYREFELGEVPYKYLLLDQVRQYCQERLDQLEAAPPVDDVYWIASRNDQRNTYDDVMRELKRIEYSWG